MTDPIRTDAQPTGPDRAELSELRTWKESASSIISHLQEIGQALNLPWGTNISANILSAVLAERERMTKNLARMTRLSFEITGNDYALEKMTPDEVTKAFQDYRERAVEDAETAWQAERLRTARLERALEDISNICKNDNPTYRRRVIQVLQAIAIHNDIERRLAVARAALEGKR